MITFIPIEKQHISELTLLPPPLQQCAINQHTSTNGTDEDNIETGITGTRGEKDRQTDNRDKQPL
jgi:hypothetical protein